MKLNAIVILWICCPLLNYETTPTVNDSLTPQNQVEYICDCGFKDLIKWNDWNAQPVTN